MSGPQFTASVLATDYRMCWHFSGEFTYFKKCFNYFYFENCVLYVCETFSPILIQLLS